MSGSQAFLPAEPSQFLFNAQGPYIIAAPGDVEPYTIGWDDVIQYPAETITSVAWSAPIGVATALNSALYCGPLVGTALSLGTWTAITAGSFALSVDGGAVTNVSGVNLSSATSFAAIAALLQTAVRTAISDTTTVTYDAVNLRFVFTSPTVGLTGKVSFLTPTGSGTDISGLLNGVYVAGAYPLTSPYQAPGVTAASTVAAMATLWAATPLVGTFEIAATLTSSLNRVKTKSFQLIVAQNT